MNQTLQIPGVDFQMLDKQRLTLFKVLMACDDSISKEDQEDLQGILEMLDRWSDGLWRQGRLGVPYPDNPQHVDNLRTIDMLGRQGFTGPDASLHESLFEYGFAWREIPEDLRGEHPEERWLIIFRKDTGDNPREFDRCPWADVDFFAEFSWIPDSKWADFWQSHGTTKLEWMERSTPERLYDLFGYFGWENVFGSDPHTFEIRDPDHDYGSEPAPGEDPGQYFERLFYGDDSSGSVIQRDFVRTKTGVWFVSGGGNQCFGCQLHQWHNNMDAIYAAGSLVVANMEVPLDVLRDAIDLLQRAVDSDRSDLAASEEWQFSRMHGKALLAVMKAALKAKPSADHQTAADEWGNTEPK